MVTNFIVIPSEARVRRYNRARALPAALKAYVKPNSALALGKKSANCRPTFNDLYSGSMANRVHWQYGLFQAITQENNSLQ